MLTKANKEEITKHVKWLVNEFNQGKLTTYEIERIKSETVNTIYIKSSELTNGSYGLNAKFENNSHIKLEISRVEFAIALARKIANTAKFGITKKEIDDAVKYFHLTVKNTKERFRLNNIAYDKER